MTLNMSVLPFPTLVPASQFVQKEIHNPEDLTQGGRLTVHQRERQGYPWQREERGGWEEDAELVPC